MSKLVLGAFNAQFLAYVRPHLAAKIAELELSSRDASLLPSLATSAGVRKVSSGVMVGPCCSCCVGREHSPSKAMPRPLV